MKTIVSTTGVEFEFNLSASRKIVIGTVPVKVTELELRELVNRLGGQINVVDDTTTDLPEADTEVEAEGASVEVNSETVETESEVQSEPIEEVLPESESEQESASEVDPEV